MNSFSASCSLDEPLCMAAWVSILVVAVLYILYKIIKFCKHKPEELPETAQFPPQQSTNLEQISTDETLKPQDQLTVNGVSRNPSNTSVNQIHMGNSSAVWQLLYPKKSRNCTIFSTNVYKFWTTFNRCNRSHIRSTLVFQNVSQNW